MNLHGVEETMLIPLAVKASETRRKKARIQDKKAVEIVDRLGEDLSRFDKFMSHEGVVARTILFDRTVESCLKKWPDAACVCIGCGLDARFNRVDNGRLLWYDLDLEPVIEVRKRFFPERERVTVIAGSALEPEWADRIEKGRKVIIILEGVLMYFTEEQVSFLLKLIKSRFPGAVILAELLPAFCAGKIGRHHDTLKETKARFSWGVKSAKEVEALCPGLRLISDRSFNVVMKHYSLRGWLFGTLPGLRNCNDRLAVYQA